MSEHIVGKTKDAGYQVGVRRTFPIGVNKAWELLFSDKGFKYWLGDCKIDKFIAGEKLTTTDKIGITLTTVIHNSHVRMKWKKQDWNNESILQVRLIPSKEKTTISFHQEKLLDAKQREEMKDFWTRKLDKILELLSN